VQQVSKVKNRQAAFKPTFLRGNFGAAFNFSTDAIIAPCVPTGQAFNLLFTTRMRLSLLQWLARTRLALRRSAPGAATGVQPDNSQARTAKAFDVDESEIDLDNPFPEPIRLEITDVFDLHTIAPRDVERVVEEYLLEAQRAGFPSVRIIHGKGRGVQRRLVQSILARTPFIREWTDAPPQSGGWGATVAHLKIENTE
jgi:hypothetical protein